MTRGRRLKRILTIVMVATLVVTFMPQFDVAQVNASTENATRVPVLTYHHVGKKGKGKLTISKAKFRSQMNWLKKRGYKTLTMNEFVEWYEGKRTIPKKSVLITFDDGTKGVRKYAVPILKRNGQHATIFIIGKYVPKQRAHHMSASTINSLRKGSVIDIESHGYGLHDRDKGRKPVKKWSKEKLKSDCMKMHDKYGCTTLCYPWGSTSNKIRAALSETGVYRVAFTYARIGEYQGTKNKYAYRSSSRYLIPRITIPGNRSWKYIKKYIK